MKEREYLARLSIKHEGNWHAIKKGIEQEENVDNISIEEHYITLLDPGYPIQLKELRNPPWVLFYQGDVSLLSTPMATIVGSRKITAYGRDVTRLATDILSRKFTIVSGLAKGVDACAHQAAMQRGHTIGVVGCGLATQYPLENSDLYLHMSARHLIISEYPRLTPIRKYHFPWRNRILAALGQCIVVTQASTKSGTLLTVNEALDLDRDIYCFPYSFFDNEGFGCNRLIAEGAIIIYDKEQLEAINPLRFKEQRLL